MILTVSPLEDKEVAAWAAVDDAAMADWPYAQAMGLGIQGSRVELVERWLTAGLHADPLQTYLKVTDDDTGELIAGALWRIGEDPPAAEGRPSGVAAQDKAAQMADAFTAARMQMWKSFQEEFFPNQAYANLQILVTAPQHRRRGAATKLIEWGTKRADELGLKSVLIASPMALGAYQKHGFKVVREIGMDLRPFGVNAMETRRWMVREPQSTKSQET